MPAEDAPRTVRTTGLRAGPEASRPVRSTRVDGRCEDQASPWRTAKAAAPARESSSSLASRLVTWKLTVRGLMYSASAISRLEGPCASSRNTSISRGVSPSAAAGSDVAARRWRRGQDSRRPAPRRRPPPAAAPPPPSRRPRTRPARAPPAPRPGRARGQAAPTAHRRAESLAQRRRRPVQAGRPLRLAPGHRHPRHPVEGVGHPEPVAALLGQLQALPVAASAASRSPRARARSPR